MRGKEIPVDAYNSTQSLNAERDGMSEKRLLARWNREKRVGVRKGERDRERAERRGER